MKINFSTFKLITKNDRKKNLPSFKNIKKDTFEHSNIILIKNWDSVVKGEIVKKIILKDLSGKKVKGYILKDISRENQYFVCANGKNQCRMIISEDEDSIYIEELYGHNNIGEFKGAGTELLKFASEISLEKGYKGKLSLKMGGSFPFYYKNNFRIDENHTDDVNIKNAALDYITREGVPKNKLWLAHWSTPIVILDEKNAKLMRNSKRLIDSSKSAVLYSKNINLKNLA